MGTAYRGRPAADDYQSVGRHKRRQFGRRRIWLALLLRLAGLFVLLPYGTLRRICLKSDDGKSRENQGTDPSKSEINLKEIANV